MPEHIKKSPSLRPKTFRGPTKVIFKNFPEPSMILLKSRQEVLLLSSHKKDATLHEIVDPEPSWRAAILILRYRYWVSLKIRPPGSDHSTPHLVEENPHRLVWSFVLILYKLSKSEVRLGNNLLRAAIISGPKVRETKRSWNRGSK